MARYNTALTTTSASANTTISSPSGGLFTEFTGSITAVTIGDPVLYSGQSQTFYNAASGSVTLTSGGTGNFVGGAGSGSTTQVMVTTATLVVQSDGVNWVVIVGAGGPVSGSTGSFSGNVTLTGATPTLALNNTAPTISTNSASSTASVFNTNATTLSMGGAATTTNLGLSGTINLGTSTGAATTAQVGGAVTGNALKIVGTAGGTVTMSSDVTTGVVNLWTGVTSGTVNLGTGMTTGTMNIGTAAAGKVSVAFNTASSSTTTGALVVTGGVGVGGALYVGSTSSLAGNVTVTGSLTATTSITSYYSDDRLKTRTGNIKNALAKVLSLDGFHYHANEIAVALGFDAAKQEVGLSAQQVQAILPEVIAPAPIDPQYMTMHYERLVPLLVEAIKELKQELDSVKNK